MTKRLKRKRKPNKVPGFLLLLGNLYSPFKELDLYKCKTAIAAVFSFIKDIFSGFKILVENPGMGKVIFIRTVHK